jgi:hypothetical protein
MRGLILAGLMVFAAGQTALAEDAAPYDPYADMVVSDDLSKLPQAVQDKRAALIAVTKSGDIEGLRAIITAQKTPPQVSFGGPDDAVAYLKTESVDGTGLETLAILRNMLEAPYAMIGATSAEPSYVWPYLAVADVEALTPGQMVDAYRPMPSDHAVDLADMGGWYYWRVFIQPDGEWSAFVAGD